MNSYFDWLVCSIFINKPIWVDVVAFYHQNCKKLNSAFQNEVQAEVVQEKHQYHNLRKLNHLPELTKLSTNWNYQERIRLEVDIDNLQNSSKHK